MENKQKIYLDKIKELEDFIIDGEYGDSIQIQQYDIKWLATQSAGFVNGFIKFYCFVSINEEVYTISYYLYKVPPFEYDEHLCFSPLEMKNYGN